MSLADFRLVHRRSFDGLGDLHQGGVGHHASATVRSHRDDDVFVGLYGNFGQSNYGAVKLALVGLMQTLGLEGGKHNVRVNCPGADGRDPDDSRCPRRRGPAAPRSEAGQSGSARVRGRAGAESHDHVCGRGHFARAHITLTARCPGGGAADAGERVIAQWEQIGDRAGELVPAYGFKQAERELAAAGYIAPTVAQK